jgi:hypothetical protein
MVISGIFTTFVVYENILYPTDNQLNKNGRNGIRRKNPAGKH